MPDTHLTIPGITLGARIGRGGMADVYVGQHAGLRKRVAVKLLHAHLVDDDDIRRRFDDEAAAVAAMRHPNIVQVYDFGLADDRPYLVMELLAGCSLAKALRARPAQTPGLADHYAVAAVAQLASALDHAHAKGVVHRDLKPANIILRDVRAPIPAGFDRSGSPDAVLTDFGIARILHVTSVTASGMLLGTPAYMAPEQVTGGAVDARSDVYALGIVLYEILTGRPPFAGEGANPASLMFKHVHDRPPRLPNHLAAYQPVLDVALAKAAGDRYLTAGDLARDLQRVAAGGAPAAITFRGQSVTQNGAIEASPAPHRSRRWGWAAVVALAALIGLGAFALVRPIQRPDGPLATASVSTDSGAVAADATDSGTSGAAASEFTPTPSRTPASDHTVTRTPTVVEPTNTQSPTQSPTATPQPSATNPPLIEVPTVPIPTIELPDL